MTTDELTCPECAETIKAAAASCRFCGHRFRSSDADDAPMTEAQKKVAKNSKIGCAVVVVGLIAMISFCTPDDDAEAGDPDGTTVATAEEDDEQGTPDRSMQMRIVTASQEGVRSRLKDPSSADFRNVGYYSGGKEGGAAVCGEVNAKNSFGAFSGFERFVAMGPEVAFLSRDVEPTEFTKVWNGLCVKADTDEVQMP